VRNTQAYNNKALITTVKSFFKFHLLFSFYKHTNDSENDKMLT